MYSHTRTCCIKLYLTWLFQFKHTPIVNYSLMKVTVVSVTHLIYLWLTWLVFWVKLSWGKCYSESEQCVAVSVCLFACNDSMVKPTANITHFAQYVYSNETEVSKSISQKHGCRDMADFFAVWEWPKSLSYAFCHLGAAIESVECKSEHSSKNYHPIIHLPKEFKFQE